MSPEEILEIAENPAVPSFVFGTPQLEEWTRMHRNQFSGICHKNSGFYVVIHPSLKPYTLPSFRVVSRWQYGQVVPHSWDVDDELPYRTSHEMAAMESAQH